LPDSAFAFVESGGTKDAEGKTVPRRLRHFPIKNAQGKYDPAHVRNALARIAQGARFSSEARPKVLAAAKALGIEVSDDSRSRSLGEGFGMAVDRIRNERRRERLLEELAKISR
jgi:hypothetical protein